MTEFNEPTSGAGSFRESRAFPRSCRPGGLTRAVASCPGLANLHNSANTKEPNAIVRPKPTRIGMPAVEEPVDCFPGFGSFEAAERELRNLLAARNSPPLSTPGLGVSPPLRTGALNPLGHSPSWMTAAPAACRSHLRLLEELQSQGATPVPGDPNLLVVSPEGGLPSGGGAFLSTGAGSEDGHLNTFGPNFKRNSPPMAVVHAAVRTPPERSGGYATQKTGRCSPSINFGISGSSSSSAREIQPLRC